MNARSAVYSISPSPVDGSSCNWSYRNYDLPMPNAIKPHGKQLVENFVEDVRGAFGITIEVLGEGGRKVRDGVTLASVRDAAVRVGELRLDPAMSVSAAEAAFHSALGLRVRIKGAGRSAPDGGTEIRVLLAQMSGAHSSKSDRNDQISITGQKKISTLQREFTEHHSHLGIMLFSSEEYAKSQQGLPVRPLKGDQTIAAVRERKSSEDISIHGNMLVKTLESRFEEIYGLYAQVCIMSDAGKKGYTGGSLDELSLSELNRRQRERGRIPFIY